MKKQLVCWLIFVLAIAAWAKKEPQVISWPAGEKPVFKFEITKIRHLSTYSGHNVYNIDVTVENLGEKLIPKAIFNLYMFDKSNVRIGDGSLYIENVRPGETIKVPVTAETTGTPVSVSLSPSELPADLSGLAPKRTVNLTVYSIPSGARLKLDGKDSGITPVAISAAEGSHILEFSKEGYTTGTFPLVIGHDQLSGGTVSFELGSSAHDTVELRDGTVLNGDVETVDGINVLVRVGGQIQKFNRNLVERIIFTVREQS